jgi:hypothetical protein
LGARGELEEHLLQPGAVRTEEPGDAAGLGGEGDVVDGGVGAVGLVTDSMVIIGVVPAAQAVAVEGVGRKPLKSM